MAAVHQDFRCTWLNWLSGAPLIRVLGGYVAVWLAKHDEG